MPKSAATTGLAGLLRIIRSLCENMDWNRIEGNWKQFQGKIKEKWGKLTDDDLTMVNGRREQLEGKIQDRYGYSRDQIRKEVDDWLKTTS